MSTLVQAVRSRGFLVIARDSAALLVSIVATIGVLAVVATLVERWS